MEDACVRRVTSATPIDVTPLVNFGLRYSGLTQKTPMDRIALAVAEEVADLLALAIGELDALPPATRESPLGRALAETLGTASETLTGSRGAFPRDALWALAKRAAVPGATPIARIAATYAERHANLERRIGWLMDGTPLAVAQTLDPAVESDRIHHAVTASFRFESRVLEMIAINRISQFLSVGNFFRSTGEAEHNPIFRFFDTYALYANVFEWGLDSLRGRRAIERMNQIHGRYYIPNDGMKYVLVQGAFTWLDGADRLAHRRITDVERQAMFLSWMRMGRAMNIAHLTDDYDEMYGWYQDFNRSSTQFHPAKRDTFETIVVASVEGQAPMLREPLLTAARVAMDDSFLSSMGYDRPSPEQTKAVRAVFFTVGSLIENLPYSPFVRSLQNNPARDRKVDPRVLGAPERSARMPVAVPGRPNGGYPEGQVPIVSAGDIRDMELPEMGMAEVRAHTTPESLWTVIDGYVYDVTPMLKVHPGGREILLTWAGKDASRAFHAAPHSAATKVFMLNYRVGKLRPDPTVHTTHPEEASHVAGP